MDLFIVRSYVEKFGGCKRVPFRWFRPEISSSDRPYADLIKKGRIKNCDPDDAKCFIDELFDADEARLLKEFLERETTVAETIIEKVRLPIARNTFPIQRLAVGGGDGFLRLAEVMPGYSLPFRVHGYFDRKGCELLDGSGIYRHRLLSFGQVRLETNEEAAARERRRRSVSSKFGDVPF